ETDDPAIIALRTRQARNMAATLLLSTGTPMITMGDELWRTQRGNNNAYCQDNEISWLDWGLPTSTEVPRTAAQDMLAFFRRTLAIRSEAPALRQGEFFDGRAPGGGDGIPDLVWFNPHGQPMTDDDWFDGTRRTLLMWVDGRDVRGHTTGGEPLTDVSWLLVLHADASPITLTLPGLPYSRSYFPVLDTGSPTGEPTAAAALSAGQPVEMPGRTVWLLRAER
ncbi:MAG: glycogen debranching enzyme GlgX, partial [Nakamurella sp.]